MTGVQTCALPILITGGPVPPNPSELIALEKTEELVSLLKKSFDCIIIDTSPIGIVSDTYHLATLADVVLLVVRPGKTLKDLFGMTLNELNIRRTKGLGLVINDNKSEKNSYRYGHKYGYTADVGSKSRFLLFKKGKRQNS